MQRDGAVDIRERVIGIIKMHPEYNKLLNEVLMPGIHSIKGIVEGLEEFLIKALERDTGKAFLFSFDSLTPDIVSKTISFDKKNHLSLSLLTQSIADLGYVKVEKATNMGEYSQKGGILDIYIFDYILRLDYFGDTLDNVLLIDPSTGAIEYNIDFVFIPKAKVHINISSYDLPLNNTSIITLNTLDSNKDFNFDFEPIPFIMSNQKLLEYELMKRENGTAIIVSRSEDNIEKIRDLDIVKKIEYYDEKFPFGFSSNKLNLSVFSDKELSGKLNLNIHRKKKNENLLLIDEISLGDLIVHEDHGIGIYNGVIKKEVLGIIKEYILLRYDKEDKLYIPLDQLSKLTKYIGAKGDSPKLTRLGTMEWERAKEKVIKSIKEIAGELLKLYALREVIEKKPIEIETDFSSQLEDSFPYELTADQQHTIEDVYRDLSSNKPMDRVIVGDVGFGKTEVAVRAGFKVIENGMQVAVISPTTILADQLLKVFKERLSPFNLNIEGLSRFQGNDSNKLTLKGLEHGKVDIVIGTHRLLQKDVKFKDLGLVIIDEEQKFGVKQKEVLKSLRIDTNILSMSATPIPRTLHMALSGARDISVINTPPTGRKPVKTSILERNWEKISEIISKEIEEGGQIYFVHNRVSSIQSVVNNLQEMIPTARIIYGHGQMVGSKLDGIIKDFRNNKFDVLVASTIIENGLDIANVNTIIINNAHRFGLSQLYQLRGRVGRSSVQSYCYLLYPEEYLLEGAARQRLYAIMNAQDLGSGLTIALKDMEIRGAGNFLGREQHGSLSAIGYELYTKLLSNEIAKLKQ